jgi:hypothetical protein
LIDSLFPGVEKIIEIVSLHVSFVIHSTRLKIAINASSLFQSFVFRFFVRWSFESERRRAYAAQHDLAATVRSQAPTSAAGPIAAVGAARSILVRSGNRYSLR